MNLGYPALLKSKIRRSLFASLLMCHMQAGVHFMLEQLNKEGFLLGVSILINRIVSQNLRHPLNPVIRSKILRLSTQSSEEPMILLYMIL